jgi:hypothetical protein
MDLIYADVVNGIIIDRGILNNYSLDLSFGQDENNFELRCPMEGTRLQENQIVYVSGTEYGGVIDSIQVDTSNLIMIYSGRTWHGILENKILYPLKGHDYMYLQGEANEVLAYLLERMNIIPGNANELYKRPSNPLMSVSTEDSGIEIDMRVTSESGNYAHGYTFIRDMLYANDAKLKIVDGVLSAVKLIDYSNDDDFLANTDQFSAKRNYNSLNRLHCLGQGNLANRYAIDLYLDSNGGLLPFCRNNPTQDSDYYTDISKLATSTNAEDRANFAIINRDMITGMNEISDIYDYPSAQTTYHYVLLTSKPADWDTDLTPRAELEDKQYGYQRYFKMERDEDGNPKYSEVTRPDINTRYNLLLTQPGDWKGNFSAYYKKTANGFEKVTSVEAYDQVSTQPSDWYNGGYANYYKLSGNNYVKVEQIQGKVLTTSKPSNWDTNCTAYCYADGSQVQFITHPTTYEIFTTAPSNWKTNYGDYYQTDGVNFTPVSGIMKTKKHDILTTQKPTDWATSYKKYWFCSKNVWKHPTNKKAPKWKANKYYMDRTYYDAPTFKPNLYYWKNSPPDEAPAWAANTFYTDGYVVPTWGTLNVYVRRTIPTWTTNTYYSPQKYRPQLIWISGTYYKQYEDHYEALIESAKKKIEEYMSKNDLEIQLDEKRVYDINDRIGASDEVTGLYATERIVQKVIKIERGVVSFSYSTGK